MNRQRDVVLYQFGAADAEFRPRAFAATAFAAAKFWFCRRLNFLASGFDILKKLVRLAQDVRDELYSISFSQCRQQPFFRARIPEPVQRVTHLSARHAQADVPRRHLLHLVRLVENHKVVLEQNAAFLLFINSAEQREKQRVVPGMKKGALVWGGQYGQGVVTCRTGHGWSAPVFIRMAGGSFGFQIGGQSTDLVLVAVNERGLQDLLKNKFKIGGDASAAAGPVGRAGQASTDWKMNAELLSYSRNKGLFAGIDLDGTSVSQNSEDTELYFGQPLKFESILKGNVDVPEGAKDFVLDVAHHFVAARNHK